MVKREFIGRVIMRAVVVGLLSLLFSGATWADHQDALLNQITLQVTAEQWVPTKTALVSVGVNAAVNDSALETIQDALLRKLNTVSSLGEWHIISYERSLDKSGLEHLQITAQARLPMAALTGIRDKVKSVSKPGETFSVDDIQFTPSMQELRDANTALRNDIYQQVKDELARISKLYPEQKYYVHEVNFNVGLMPPGPMPMNAMMQAKAGGGSFAVGDKLVLRATAVLGSMAEPAVVKNPHL
jgi:hypothetical protein